MQDRKQDEIRNTALFRGCSPQDVRWIAKVADTVDLPAGRTVVRKGSWTKEFVVLVSGSASAFDGEASVCLAPGAYVGAAGLIDDSPHSMTVETIEPTRVLVFSPGAFRGMLHRIPSVGRKLLADKVTDLRKPDQAPRSLRAVS